MSNSFKGLRLIYSHAPRARASYISLRSHLASALLLLSCSLTLSCQAGQSCSSPKTAKKAQPLNPTQFSPLESSALVRLQSTPLLSLANSPWTEQLNTHLRDTPIISLCQDSQAALGESLCSPELYDAFRIAPQEPLHITFYKQHWILAFSSTPELDPPQPLPSLPHISLNASTDPSLTLISNKENHTHSGWIHQDGLSVLIIPQQHAQNPDTHTLAQHLLHIPKDKQWRASADFRTLQQALEEDDHELYMILKTKTLSHLFNPTTKNAKNQLDSLLNELHLSAITLDRSSSELGRFKGQLLLGSDPKAPILTSALNPSEHPFPDHLGALLSHQTRGVIHLAANTPNLFEFLKKSVNFEQQKQFNKYLTYLKDELLLDVEGALVQNIQGHFFVILYEDPNTNKSERTLDLLGLDHTHEAIYIPIQDSFALEQLLNGITQISHNSWRRQQVDDVIQYVWVEDKTPIGALLLGENALMWVDSSHAAERAMDHFTSPKTLSKEQLQRFSSLKKSRHGFSVWLDPSILESELLQGIDELTLSSYQTEHNGENELQSPQHTHSANFSIKLKPSSIENNTLDIEH